MAWFNAVVLYVLVWWTLLFAVLPLGTKPQPDPDPATGWRGAPERPRIGQKILQTTVLSAVVWLGMMAVIRSDWLSFRTGWLAMTGY